MSVRPSRLGGGEDVLGFVDDEGVKASVGAVAGDEGGVLGEDLVEGGLRVALDGGGDHRLPVGALDEVEEVAVEVADDELAVVGLGGDAVAGARHCLGGFAALG
jgi:hypothetical protein